ncbi:MAG TPA: dihydrodipicolinate synthase family protein [Anaerolineales bacterium]|nr:dihydrodipicolinate synthase family protein [Anaerolineales bacterium]
MSARSELNLAGIFPPIPTPFTDKGGIAFDQLSTNLSRWNEWPLGGYVVGGSNGEFVSQTFEERVAVVQAVRKEMPADHLLIAGAGMHSTQETVDLTHAMAAVGADIVLIVTPSYYKSRMDLRALRSHYHALAEASTVPVVLYNVPANTGLDMSADIVLELAQHPNIVGIKDSSGNMVKMGLVVHAAPEGFQVLAGSGSFFLPALAIGAVGLIAALVNIAAVDLARIQKLFCEGQISEARNLQLKLIETNSAVTSRFGVAGLKAALDLLGFYGGPVRPPLQPLLADELDELGTILERAGLLSANG